ncbi:hypothetical protein VspDsh1_30 [Vibrio phage VspDsh_1]|nr:hypothetical protein VspDsh1_30 [Vibrio phage VspDsh_1]
MVISQFIDVMKQMGLHPRRNSTGDEKWEHVRVYARTGDEPPNHRGTYVCIAKFLIGNMYNFKWMVGDREVLTSYCAYPTIFNVYLETKRIIGLTEFNEIHCAAGALAEAKYHSKKEARAKLEARDRETLDPRRAQRRKQNRKTIKRTTRVSCIPEATRMFIEAMKEELE